MARARPPACAVTRLALQPLAANLGGQGGHASAGLPLKASLSAANVKHQLITV